MNGATVRFGHFELDLTELRYRGRRRKLERLPMDLLHLLIERRGDLVSRDEIAERLWGKTVFVETENNINAAIRKIRRALNDAPDHPKFVQTVTRRGYRFIAPAGPVASSESTSGSATALGTPSPDGPESHHQVATKRADRIESLAVLPLENLSGDPAEEFFADGMTEELISAVARIGSLRVISRTSVMQYKGARKSLAEIANQLRVDAIVEGSVTRSGERVRIVAQLIRVPEDRHAWSGRYERDLRDVLQMQAEVAQSIAGQVHKLLDPDCPGIPLRQVDPRAYEACLKGDFFRNKLSPADLKKSLRFFNQAIDLDPSYAPAYAGLSQTYYFLGVFGIGQPEHLVSRMRANAVRALELDETIAAAHNSLAAAHVFQNWDWAAAEAESRRALELDSRVSTTHAYLADYLSIRGCHDEAIVELHRALDLDPISLPWMGLLGLILYRARRYDEAIVQCLKALEIDGNYVNALWFLALALEQKGELSEAIAKLQQAANLSDGPHYQALLGRAYALAGERAKALGILEALFGLTRQRYVSPFDFGVLCAGLDDRDASLQWFEEAFHERVWRMSELTMPMFDGLRSEARWRNLVRRIGLQI